MAFLHTLTQIYSELINFEQFKLIFWNLASLNELFRVLFRYLNVENRFARCTWVCVVLMAVIMLNYARMHVCVFVCIFVHSCECVCARARACLFVSVPACAHAQWKMLRLIIGPFGLSVVVMVAVCRWSVCRVGAVVYERTFWYSCLKVSVLRNPRSFTVLSSRSWTKSSWFLTSASSIFSCKSFSLNQRQANRVNNPSFTITIRSGPGA